MKGDIKLHILFSFSILFCLGCGDIDSEGARDSVVITISGEYNGQPLSCESEYSDAGEAGNTISISDFRLYVHDIHVIGADSERVPVELEQSSPWQFENVVLLDYEDRTGSCLNGTIETNNQIIGTVPAGTEFQAVTFQLGVPFELNHQDQATAATPLNLTSMFWGWQAGYKFLRLDLNVLEIDDIYRIHLGSTGCAMDENNLVSSCSHPNRAEVVVENLVSSGGDIVFDLMGLLAGIDVGENDESTGIGCMSDASDSDCEPVFEVLGLNLASGVPQQPVNQSVFYGN